VPCADGEPGELLGRIAEGRTAAGRFEGYTSREATEKKILRDVFEPGDAWFRTGDLLSRDADGYYYFVDRIGDTFRWKGENVSTQQVAEAVGGEPGVALCACLRRRAAGPGGPRRHGRGGARSRARARRREPVRARSRASCPPTRSPRSCASGRRPISRARSSCSKVDAAAAGLRPAATADPIYYRDDAGRAYQRLDASLHELVVRGALRF
jgi:fatty-acyl-CoA synthase